MPVMRSLALPLAILVVAGPAARASADDGGLALHVHPRGGVAFHPQLGSLGPAAGVDVRLGVAANGLVGVGLAVEHLRFAYARTNVPVGTTGRADLEATLAVTPVLLELEARFPIAGRLSGFAGAGAGPFFTRVETRATGGTAGLATGGSDSIALGGAALAGLGLSVGPGRFTIEGRFHVASGEVDGAAKGVSAGGLSGQAGYELDL
jgi:hypothetical protein